MEGIGYKSFMRFFRSLLFICVFLFLPISFLGAQPKTLDWDQISVDAFLDEEGNLDVLESQKIRFTGDWNGAYRRFDVGWGQKIKFLGVEKKNSDGKWIPLQSRDTIFVDSYLYDPLKYEVKWRSRETDDPPFNNDVLEYRIHLRYANILKKKGESQFRLEHDFSFSDRNGRIGSMDVHLKLDEKWKVVGRDDSDLTFLSSAGLSPEEKMVVRLDLNFSGKSLEKLTPGIEWIYFLRFLSIVSLIVVLGGINFLLYLYAKKIGVMDEPKRITSWKEFKELLGDSKPEFIAILAESGVTETWMTRLIFERKLQCEKTSDGKMILRKLVTTESFSETDQKIIKYLFVVNDTVVNSGQIKEHYKSKKTSYSLKSDIELYYEMEMDRLGFTVPRNSLVEKCTGYVMDKIFSNSFFSLLFIFLFGAFYLFILSDPLNENGVSFARFIVSFLSVIFTIFGISFIEDVHYGFYDLKLYRTKYFYSRFGRSLIPGIILLSFYVWSLEISDNFFLLLLGIFSFISLQHIVRLAPHTHIKQIQSSLQALALKNFLEHKLLSNEKCDIPLTYSPLIPALDLSFTLRYRKENLNLDDTAYLLPENYQTNIEIDIENQTGPVTISSTLSSGTLGSTSSFAASGGEFGGGGSSASWSDMESFSSSSSYTTPSSSSSSSGSSSSGGGGGGGW